MDSAASQLGQVGRRVVTILGLVAVLVSLGAAASPGVASAFVGESLVIDPVTKTLTGPAQTVLKNPTFLAAEPVAGSTAVGTELTTVAAAEGAGLLPAVGAFAAGFAIGTVAVDICNSYLSGCMIFEHNDAGEVLDPVEKGNWQYHFSKTNGVPPLHYAWHNKSGSLAVFTDPKSLCKGAFYPAKGVFYKQAGGTCGAGGTADSGQMGRIGEDAATWSTGGIAGAGGKPDLTGSVYCPVNSSGASLGCASTPSTTWADKLADRLGHPSNYADNPTQTGILGQHIASAIPGSEVKDPYKNYVTIPSCDEVTWGACKAALEEKGLEPIREDLDWSEVTTDVPDQVQEMHPAKSTEVEVPSKVKVITNPDESGMPLVVPSPESGETYSHYAARLNPSLTPERHDLEAAFVDPGVGPNGVVEVSPEPETKLDPSTTHKVNVTTNPADAPLVAPPWSPPSIASIDMGPISGVPSPCTVFPFGLFCWMGEAFAQFNTTGTCPHFSTPVEGTDADFVVTMCGETADTIMGYLRPALLLAFIVGCGLLFAKGTKAIGGD